MRTGHQAIVQLIIAYTLVGAFVFTVIMTCLSRIGWVRFADAKQQRRLFVVLIIALVTIGLGVLSNFLELDPGLVVKQIETRAIVGMWERTRILLALVDTLPDQRAIALVANPPTSFPDVERIIQGVDPQNLRASDPDVARQTLKIRIVDMLRHPGELNVWQRALSE